MKNFISLFLSDAISLPTHSKKSFLFINFFLQHSRQVKDNPRLNARQHAPKKSINAPEKFPDGNRPVSIWKLGLLL